MDLDQKIEDTKLPNEEKRVQESIEVEAELVTQEPFLFEEESMTLHST
jgi:hypothetical protein